MINVSCANSSLAWHTKSSHHLILHPEGKTRGILAGMVQVVQRQSISSLLDVHILGKIRESAARR